jgi:GT2 family glycosyltransferase
MTAGDPQLDGPIGVVVVSFGPADLLRRTLATLDLPGPDVRVVVVDNFSTAENRREIEELGAVHAWHVVGMPDNRGFGAACNAGVDAARGLGCRTFLFLNPDALISASVVAQLREHSLREPNALISPLLVDSAGEVVFRAARTDLRDGRVYTRPDDADPATRHPGDWLCGACLVVHDDLLRRIGGFDETYFLYWEDVDLGYRAIAAGGTVVLRDDLVAVHDEGGTHGVADRGRAKSPLYYRYNCRNRLVFAARHLRRRQLLRWLLTTPAVSWEILLRGGRRQLVRSPRPWWAAITGSLAGISLALPALLPGRRLGGTRSSVLVVSPGADLYGSDRVLLESVEALLRVSDVVVALPTRGPLVAELECRGAQVLVVRMPVLRKVALRPSGLARLLRDAVLGLIPAFRLLREVGCETVFVNTTVLPFWLVVGRLAGRRVVCHVHEAEWPGPAVLRRALLRSLTAADVVIANSSFTRDALTGLVPAIAARTTAVPNPVHGLATPVAPRATLQGPVRLLFVGRLSPRKGPQVAIAALQELLSRGMDARLSLLGSVFEGYEWFERELRAAAGELPGRVDFLGFRTDVAPVLAEADVVLVPSILDESFGLVAVEAVLAARPTLVSALGGLQEASASYDGVQMVPPGRPELWADAVERVIAQWAVYRAAAVRDASDAARRHSPRRYQARVLEVVEVPRRAVPGTPGGTVTVALGRTEVPA